MTKPNTDAVAALKAQLAGQLVAHHMGPQSIEKYKEKPTNFVYASNGIFRVIPTEVALFITKVAEVDAKTKIPGLPEMQEDNQLLIPKIPFKYWLQVLSFYKDVHKKDGTEASIVFFWNHANIDIPTKYESGRDIKGLTIDGQLIVYCPEQKNSGTLSNFTADTMVPWLRARTTPLLETHSHHTMGAFWSGTDDANENMTQFYGVYGQITSAEPQFLFRYVSGEHKININHYELFEQPRLVTTKTLQIPGFEAVELESTDSDVYKGPWPMVEYPEDWIEQHSKSWGASTYYQKQTAPGAGAATPSNNGYSRWPDHSSWADEEWEAEFGHSPLSGTGGARRSTTSANQTDVRSEVKKKTVNATSNNPSKKNSNPNKTDDKVADVIETSSSYIELVTSSAIDESDMEDIKKILNDICDFGYDYSLVDVVKEQSNFNHTNL